jgi:hypothetical protein
MIFHDILLHFVDNVRSLRVFYCTCKFELYAMPRT